MNKRGAAAVLAMIFLVIFGALSFAFYAVISTSIAVARNDRDAQHARAAAESGMEYLKHAISWKKIKSTVPDQEHLAEVREQLEAISQSWSTDMVNGSLLVPASGTISLQSGTHAFDAQITEDFEGDPMLLHVRVTGRDTSSGLSRTISAMFYPRDVGKGTFRYSCATPGGIYISGGTMRAGKGLMSGTFFPDAILLSGATVDGGQLAVTGDDSQVRQLSVKGEPCTVAVVPPPTFPEFDTTAFRTLATNPYVKNQSPMRNVRIKASDLGGSKSVQIGAGTVIEGIMYVDAGINVDFRGNVTLKGVIVCEQDPGKQTIIDMRGTFLNVREDNPSYMSPALQELAAGVTILAPTADIVLGGNASLDTLGSVICRRLQATSSGGDITIRNGTLLALYDGQMHRGSELSSAAIAVSNRTITFSVDGQFEFPGMGLVYKKAYVMMPDTYLEH